NYSTLIGTFTSVLFGVVKRSIGRRSGLSVGRFGPGHPRLHSKLCNLVHVIFHHSIEVNSETHDVATVPLTGRLLLLSSVSPHLVTIPHLSLTTPDDTGP